MVKKHAIVAVKMLWVILVSIVKVSEQRSHPAAQHHDSSLAW